MARCAECATGAVSPAPLPASSGSWSTGAARGGRASPGASAAARAGICRVPPLPQWHARGAGQVQGRGCDTPEQVAELKAELRSGASERSFASRKGQQQPKQGDDCRPSTNPHEAEQRPNGRKATNWKMRACACRCTIWVHHELIYGSKIFSTVLSNIVSCSTSGGRLSSPIFEKFRNGRHSSVTLCPLHRVAPPFLSSVAYPPDVPRANATRSSIFPRHSASTSIPLDPRRGAKPARPCSRCRFSILSHP